MVLDERRDFLFVLIREVQALADLLGHPRADLHMSVEADAPLRPARGLEGRRLADIMKQNSPTHRRRASCRKLLEHKPRVNPDVAFGMELRRLFHAFHSRYLR